MPEKLQIVIDAKDQASPVLKGVAGTAKTEFAGMAGSIKAHAGEIRAAGMATMAFGAATLAVAKGNLDAHRKQEMAQAKLTAAVKGTAQAIDQSRLEKLASELQDITTFGDEATIEMMALLTTFSLTQDQIEGLAPRIQNISAMMGTDMKAAAVAVGKAISMGSASALQRYGIIIDEATMKSGDFNAILKAIDANTGPAAEELAKGAGAAEQLSNQFGDLREVAGEALVPALKATTAVLKPMVSLAQTMVDTPVGKAFVLAATGAGLLAVPLGALLMMLPTAVRGWELLTGAQLRNAAAARTAAAANTQAGAAAAAGGAAAGGGGLLRGAGIAAGARAVGGAALRYALPAYIAYEGSRAYLGSRQAKAEAQVAAIEAGETETPEEKALIAANMERWADEREQQGLAPDAIPSLAAIPSEQMISDQMLAGTLAPEAAAAPAPRSLAGITELGSGAFAFPAAPEPAYAQALRSGRSGRSGHSLPVAINAEGVTVTEEPLAGGGRKLVFEVNIPADDLPQGILDDGTTAWMEDLQYAQGAG